MVSGLNTALIGAKLFLYEDNIRAIPGILDKTRHINLKGTPEFQDIYISKLMLS